VLVLDDSDSLIDSGAILDALDEMAGAERRLTPETGLPRRQVLKLTAVGVGAAEKVVWAVYEGRFHPPEKVHQPWIDHNEKQAVAGFGFLDAVAAKAGNNGWLAGTDRMSQADITAAVAFAFAQKMRPNLGLPEKAPSLARFAARCEALDAFRRAPLPA
jgi:glutathione S-transferase